MKLQCNYIAFLKSYKSIEKDKPLPIGTHQREVKEMKKFDYRNVLVNGNEYECARTISGKVYLFYVENGYIFDDTMHDGFLSKTSYFVTPDQIFEVRTIDFVNYNRLHFLPEG